MRERGRSSRFAAALAAFAILLFATAPGAGANPPPPLNLRVLGEEPWHAENRFQLKWDGPGPLEGPPLVAVRVQVRDALGAAVNVNAAPLEPWWVTTVSGLPAPGIYTAEVRFVDSSGAESVPASTELRFDNLRPSKIEAVPTSGWISRTAFPHAVRLGQPSGRPPVSGIRGYAVSIDGAATGDPCAGAETCTDAETDLRGDDVLWITGLPEGTNYVHAVAVSGSRMKSVAPTSTALHVDTIDPLTSLTGLPDGWTNRASTLIATARDATSGMQARAAGALPFTAIRIDGGAPIVEDGPSATATVIDEGVHEIAYYARDAAGNVNDGGTSNGVANAPPALALVRIDRTPPDVAFANAQDPRDPELIQLGVRDSLSGADATRGWIGVRRVGSGDRFEALAVEPAAAGLQARWPSDTYPAGEYEFRAVGYDRAGNETATESRANGSRMVLRNPLKTATRLRAAFAGGPSGTRLVGFGRSVRLAGRLIVGVRTPLSGMPVHVLERFAPGSLPAERLSTVVTGADGAFSIRLAPGPSREVTASFAGSRTLAASSAEVPRLAVRSRLRLRVSSPVATVGGRPVIFSGAVASGGGAIPADGKSVELQFRAPGLSWSAFRTVQSDHRGRFRYAYRFSDTESRGVSFQFRAYAPAQSGWPYEPASSRPVTVRGR